TTLSPLGRWDFFEPWALGINDVGDLVGSPRGYGRRCDNDQDWLYRDGAFTPVGFPSGYFGGAGAYDVNNRGEVVGNGCLAPTGGTSPSHAFVWDDGTVTDLGTLGGTDSTATAISDTDKIVGYSQIAGDGAEHACVYQDRSMRDLGTLGGLNSRALAVN